MREDWQFWDLKLLESGAEEMSDKVGAMIHGKKDDDDETFTEGAENFPGKFMYKICQSQWDYPHEEFDAPKRDELDDEEYKDYVLTSEQK